MGIESAVRHYDRRGTRAGWQVQRHSAVARAMSTGLGSDDGQLRVALRVSKRRHARAVAARREERRDGGLASDGRWSWWCWHRGAAWRRVGRKGFDADHAPAPAV